MACLLNCVTDLQISIGCLKVIINNIDVCMYIHISLKKLSI